MTSDLYRAGSPESGEAFFRPLIHQLRGRAPGRVEVVPLQDHWESAYVAGRGAAGPRLAPAGRRDRNPIFYADRLEPAAYTAC